MSYTWREMVKRKKKELKERLGLSQEEWDFISLFLQFPVFAVAFYHTVITYYYLIKISFMPMPSTESKNQLEQVSYLSVRTGINK